MRSFTNDRRSDLQLRSGHRHGNGNRLSGLLPNGNTQSYSYSPATNRLVQKGNQAITLDAAGNTVSDRNENRQFQYNDAGRLTQVTRQGTLRGTYTYNHQSQRTRKVKVTNTGVTKTFVYHYDMQGRLLTETQEDGTPIRAYVWADNEPIAQIQYKQNQQTDQLLYLHADHLGTPRLATDSTQTPVWRWESQAFGQGQPDSDPDDDSINHFVRLRLAGQYYDGESGLFYNWNRYYDPKIGRYITTDPIGIDGGLNTYRYVDNNPLRYIDPEGLMGQGPGGGGSAPGPYGFGGSGKESCPEEKCPWAITITWSYGLSHAPIRPSVTKVYSGKCLLTFGLGVKGTSMAVTTAAASVAPGALSARGYTRAAAVAGRAAAVASSPPGWVVGGVLAADATLDFCECK